MNQEAHNQIAVLLRLFQEHRLEELLIEDGAFKLHLRRDPAPAPPASAPPRPAAPGRGRITTASTSPQPPTRGPRTVAIRSPLIGIFYRAPTPDAPPLVDIGEHVEEGQTIGIVEAMKVFNEIKAEWSGRVVAVPAENGKLVQAGEPLVVLEFTLADQDATG